MIDHHSHPPPSTERRPFGQSCHACSDTWHLRKSSHLELHIIDWKGEDAYSLIDDLIKGLLVNILMGPWKSQQSSSTPQVQKSCLKMYMFYCFVTRLQPTTSLFGPFLINVPSCITWRWLRVSLLLQRHLHLHHRYINVDHPVQDQLLLLLLQITNNS